jgi:hypothetical protein
MRYPDRKAVRARVKDIAAGVRAGPAANKAIDAVNACLAIIIAAGAGAAGGRSG